MVKKKSQIIRNQVLEIFRSHGGVLKTSEALALGIHPRILYELRDSGLLERVMKGVYALPDFPGIDQPDFVTIAKKVPRGVICLISALYFHELTIRIPRLIDVAVKQGYCPPKIAYPPVQYHWFSANVFESGVEKHNMSGVTVKIYSREKTVVDCFRVRRKMGVDVAVEALKTYWEQDNPNMTLLEKYARESRVTKVMKPYIQSIIHDQS